MLGAVEVQETPQPKVIPEESKGEPILKKDSQSLKASEPNRAMTMMDKKVVKPKPKYGFQSDHAYNTYLDALKTKFFDAEILINE